MSEKSIEEAQRKMENVLSDVDAEDFERFAESQGYNFREILSVGGHSIKIYEKPEDLTYLPIQALNGVNDLKEEISDLVKVLNRNYLLIDDFDVDHAARRKWEDGIVGTNDEVVYEKFDSKNKLGMNRVNVVTNLLGYIISMNFVKDQTLNQKLKEISNGLSLYVKSNKMYYERKFSLKEKLEFMEEVDRIIKEILDILKQAQITLNV